ncbi:hypothetical protein PENSPDRAFT_549785, partial [Peniophora sp. CONT]
SSVHAATGYAPFELTYGYMPRMISSIRPKNQDSPGVVSFVQQALETLAMAHDAILTSRLRSTLHANTGRREE